ncbi:hypothetical protein V6N12_058116 [Hibiscus sabdariffa]|uniref:Uncharacterized protein n=1 Tax=Hibiscus sabdariffa TaxID=183260 RepID=A0ABR2ARA8_9ROSI
MKGAGQYGDMCGDESLDWDCATKGGNFHLVNLASKRNGESGTCKKRVVGATSPISTEISAIKYNIEGGVRKGGYVSDSFLALAIVKQTY